MVYPVKMHVRYSTVLVIVLLLMGSVLYEVTRTESLGRQSAARTQDSARPAPQPVVHTVRAYTNFIGNSSMGRSAIQPFQPDREFLASAAYGSVVTAAFFRRDFFQHNFAPRGLNAAFGGRSLNGRARSSGGSGFAAGSYGMGGVGAWGGVSGVMRPISNLADRPGRRVGQTRTSTPAPRRNNGTRGGGTSGGGSSADSGGFPAGGFSTGAAAVEPGAVVDVTGGGASPSQSPAPAPTPEPMSILLVGTGLAALYKVRQHLQ
jgi:hypothetical protein